MLVLALIVGACALAACGDGTTSPKVARSVDVSALTFEDVQHRARAAATKPGVITHTSETIALAGSGEFVFESWLDLERSVARVDENGRVTGLFAGGRYAMFAPDRRYSEYADTPAPGDLPLLGFNYLARITNEGAEETGIDEAVVDGTPAIRVRVEQETNSDGDRRTEKATIYLDEAFLPLNMDLDRGDGLHSTHTYRNEYLARDAVAEDFFSFEPLRAIANTATQDQLREAGQAFGRAYWLDDPFEAMILDRVGGGTIDGEPPLDLSYGMQNAGTGGPDAPYPCVHISQETTQGWQNRQQLRASRNLNPSNRVERDARTVLGGAARIFEDPADHVIQQPYIVGQLPPTPVTLAESSLWSAEIVFADAVVELSTNCGPAGKNPYRSLDGMRHLLDALRTFDAH